MQIAEIISWSRGDTLAEERERERERDRRRSSRREKGKVKSSGSSQFELLFVALRNVSTGHDFYALLLVGPIDKRALVRFIRNRNSKERSAKSAIFIFWLSKWISCSNVRAINSDDLTFLHRFRLRRATASNLFAGNFPALGYFQQADLYFCRSTSIAGDNSSFQLPSRC